MSTCQHFVCAERRTRGLKLVWKRRKEDERRPRGDHQCSFFLSFHCRVPVSESLEDYSQKPHARKHWHVHVHTLWIFHGFHFQDCIFQLGVRWLSVGHSLCVSVYVRLRGTSKPWTFLWIFNSRTEGQQTHTQSKIINEQFKADYVKTKLNVNTESFSCICGNCAPIYTNPLFAKATF